MTEIKSQSNMESVTVSRTEHGMRVQINFRGGLVAAPETIVADVLLKHADLKITELQAAAVRRSIELLQEFLEWDDLAQKT